MIPKELLIENLACLGMVRSIYSFFFKWGQNKEELGLKGYVIPFGKLNNSIKDLT